MNDSLPEDWLEARLREEVPYIDDAGFTAQVLHKLPARSARRSLRGAFLLALTMLACVVTYFVSDGGNFLISAMNTIAAMPLWLVYVVVVIGGVIATGVAAGAAYYQVREEG